ncbi:hypothetical protein OPT61_g9675 [Boeremia exigua]|uniref:Uncharacterized protein n=1 Tax=Boeremia exigua TaxID=749465 RepID=A0ACC2HTL1_9PLEO|nr:hypothetical protein OPT61_g9675 [Boeremia exigua]
MWSRRSAGKSRAALGCRGTTHRMMSGDSENRKMIEAGEDEEEYGALVPQQNAQAGGNGILSGSTLAALKGYTATATNKRPAPSGPLLAGYGSDDDSD